MSPYPSDEARKAAHARGRTAAARQPRSPLSKRGDHVLDTVTARLAADFVEYLPDEISGMGVVSYDALPSLLPETLAALERDGEIPAGLDAESFTANHGAILRDSVVHLLRQQGIQVVDRQHDALRVLAETHQLRADQLPAFKDILLNDHAKLEEAHEAARRGAAYTILADGTLRPGLQLGERYVIVRD